MRKVNTTYGTFIMNMFKKTQLVGQLVACPGSCYESTITFGQTPRKLKTKSIVTDTDRHGESLTIVDWQLSVCFQDNFSRLIKTEIIEESITCCMAVGEHIGPHWQIVQRRHTVSVQDNGLKGKKVKMKRRQETEPAVLARTLKCFRKYSERHKTVHFDDISVPVMA